MRAPSKWPANSRRKVWILNPRRGGIWTWVLRYYAFVIACMVPLGCAAGWATFAYFSEQVPAVGDVARYSRSAPGITRIYDSQGTLLAEVAREHRAYVPLADVPPQLIHAFLAAEDRRFFEHHGLDFRGLARAMIANLRSGTIVQGGSTITQQVSKSFLHDRQRTLARKAVEAILALKIESTLGKETILETYLNKIFLGHQAYGVAAAADRYFGKALEDLTLAESAMIAGLARAPSRFSPSSHPKAALRRRSVVLRDMEEAGYIDQAAREAAERESLDLTEPVEVFRVRAPYYAEAARQAVEKSLGSDAVLRDGLRIESAANLRMQYEARQAVDASVRELDRKHGWSGPVAHLPRAAQQKTFLERVRARYGAKPFTDDPKRWRLALVEDVKTPVALVRVGDTPARLPLPRARWASRYNRNSGVNGESISDLRRALQPGDVVWVQPTGEQRGEYIEVRLGQPPRVEAAIWTQDHQTGYVDAVVGGVDYDLSQFNRALQACRQPGSVFKAVYYALALDSDKWQADSVLEAKPWQPEPGETWNPRNIGKTIDGKVLVRTALIKSMNTPSIRLFVSLGAQAVVEWSRQLGMTSELIADKGLSLGASCVRHDEIGNVFATFVRGGSRIEPTFIKRVIDKTGRTRIDHRAPLDPVLSVGDRIDAAMSWTIAPPRQVMRESTAFLITRLLREVVTHGIGVRAGQIGVPAAGKSGSASGRFQRERGLQDLTTDTWFVGFTSRHVTTAWMGFDDAQERSLGDEEASYTTATPLWTDYMTKIVEGEEDRYGSVPMSKPPGIASRTVDATHGGEPIPGLPSAQIFHRRNVPPPRDP